MIKNLGEEADLLDRHLVILGHVLAAGPIGIVELANQTGFTKYQVRYSLRMLEEGGIIEPTPDGAVQGDRAGEFLATYEDEIDGVIGRLATLAASDTTLPAE